MRTIGKTRGLARLADADGHFRMVALDQRPPMFDAIAQAKKITRDQVDLRRRHGGQAAAGRGAGAALQFDAVRSEFRGAGGDRSDAGALRADHDARRASGRGNAGRPQVARRSTTGAWPRSAPWAVTRSRCWPGTGRTPMPLSTRISKRFVREIGEECARNDIPYVLELLVYPFLGSANHTADYVESPGKLPSLVIESVREFAKPEYGVDLLKLESPLAANSSAGPRRQRRGQGRAEGVRRHRRDLQRTRHSLGPAVGRRRARQVRARARLRLCRGRRRLPRRPHDLARCRREAISRTARRSPQACARKALGVLDRLNELTSGKGETWNRAFPVFS